MRREPLALFALLLWAAPAGTCSAAPAAGPRPVGNRSLATATSPGQWTWVAGPSRVAESALLGAYGTKGVADPGNTPGARRGAITWRDASGSLWLFGGYGWASSSYGALNDLWKWDGTSWTWVGGTSASDDPGHLGTRGVPDAANRPRARMGAVGWTDSAGALWLFGGLSLPDPYLGVRFNDLWKWDGTSWTWVNGPGTDDGRGVYGTKGTGGPDNWPGAREGGATWKDPSGNVWLFGGKGLGKHAEAVGPLADLWKWDGSTWTWVSGADVVRPPGVYGTKGVASPTNVPGGRRGAVARPDAGGVVHLFGGEGLAASGEGLLNDLWRWDGTSWTWLSGSDAANTAGSWGTKGVANATNVPSGRMELVTFTGANGKLRILGGWGLPASGARDALNDVWELDGSTWTWIGGSDLGGQPGTYGLTGVADPGNEPGARWGSAVWAPAPGVVWTFGGEGASSTGRVGVLNDLWRSDGAWTWMSGSDGSGLAGVYGTRGVPSAANVPGARTGSVTWRTPDGAFWLFGGNGYSARGKGYLNDLWRWDGDWTWIGGSRFENDPGVYGPKGVPSAGNLPRARSGASSGFDAAGNLWLFGGWHSTDTGGSLNDLWKWDGSAWTWLSGASTYDDPGHRGTKGVPDAANVPSGRRHAAAWTDASGRFWVFGGSGPADRRSQDDLWRWDGEAWTWIFGGDQWITALARRGAESWVDHDGHVWLFGGLNAAGQRLNDLWRWDGVSWTHASGSWEAEAAGTYGTRGVASPGNSPGARWLAHSWTDARGHLWLFGGHGRAAGGEGSLNDLWRWDGRSWAWIAGSESASAPGVYGTLGTPAPGNVPGARAHSATWTAADGSPWLFGGGGQDSEGAAGWLQDLWTYAPPECSSPDATITAPEWVLGDSGGNPASVPDSGAGATYEWTITGGTIASGHGTRTIAFSVGPEATSVLLSVTVRLGDCTSTATESIPVGDYLWLDVRRVGSGTVHTTAGDFSGECMEPCRRLVLRGATVTLVAYPSVGSRLEGWTGVSCAEETVCTFTMTAPTTVTATFGPVTQPGPQPGSFYTVAPCRVVDTRGPAGPFGAPALAPGTARPFAIGGACGVPADAKAVVLNVTAVGPTQPGSLTVYPGLSTAPETSVVVFAAGATRAGHVSVGLVDGFLSVLYRQHAGTVDLVIDVSGFYR